MTELSRSLLAAARDGLAPDPAIAARVRAKVAAAVGAPPPSPSPAPAVAKSGALLVKLGAVLLVAGVVTGIAVLGRGATVDAPRVPALVADEEIDQPASATPAQEAPAAIATEQPVIHLRKQQPASLSREVELIDQAMASLRARDARAALAALHTFDRETLGHAQMAEEAAAIGIEAHCTLHEDVSARLAAFDRSWPSSAQRARITAACW